MSLHETGLLARDDPTDRELVRLLGQLDDLLDSLEVAESEWSDWLAAVAPGYGHSARNMVQYWAIRQSDLRELQSRLGAFGLSSLGRSESHVEATLRLVRSAVVAMLEDTWHPPERAPRSARMRVASCCGDAP
jgi:pyruvate kinase